MTKNRNFTIGTLTKKKSAETGVEGFMGNISIRGLAGPIALGPNTSTPEEMRTDKTPKYTVLMDFGGNNWLEIGKAWEKPLKTNKGTWLSITLDGPNVPNRENVSAFYQDGSKDTLDIQWSRNKPNTEQGDAPQVVTGSPF